MANEADKISQVNPQNVLAFSLSEEEKKLINFSEKVKSEKSPYYFGATTGGSG